MQDTRSGGAESTPIDLVLSALEGQGKPAKRSGGNGWEACCPAHEDGKPSLSIDEKGDGTVLLHCHAGCDLDAILARLGLERRDLFPEQRPKRQRSRIVKQYPYRDERGQLLFEVVRYDPKDFRQRRPKKGGGWAWDMHGVRRVLYRLPETLAAIRTGSTAYIVEGEKDVETLTRLGLAATCNPGGAGKWRKEYSEALRGARVVIVPDGDEPGRRHAAAVANALHGEAASVRVIALPDGAKDVSAWQGASREALEALGAATAEWTPTPEEAQGDAEKPKERDTAARRLWRICQEAEVVFCRDTGGRLFAQVPVAAHLETLALVERGGGFRHWLVGEYLERHAETPNASAVQAAMAAAEALAATRGPRRPVCIRTARHDGLLYIDLADEQRRVVEVAPGSWRVIDSPAEPFFYRPAAMGALPEPKRDGDGWTKLRELLGGRYDETGRILAFSWLLGAMMAAGPYPMLAFFGEQGCGKSMATRLWRFLVDPAGTDGRELLSPPRSEDDLWSHALSRRVCAYDNATAISEAQADGFCRLATGGGIGKRALYTDADLHAAAAARPLIINGIAAEILNRPDLISRTLPVRLSRPEAQHGVEREETFWRRAEQVRPAIFGAICDALALGLERIEELPPAPYRLCDFASLVIAAEPALPWAPGAFEAAYRSAQESSNELALDADPLSQWVEELSERGGFEGTPSELLAALSGLAGENLPKAWPANAAILGKRLTVLAPALRDKGVEVRKRASNGLRGWVIRSDGRAIKLPSLAVTVDGSADTAARSGSDGSDGTVPAGFEAAGTAEKANICGSEAHSDGSDGTSSLISNMEEKEGKAAKGAEKVPLRERAKVSPNLPSLPSLPSPCREVEV